MLYFYSRMHLKCINLVFLFFYWLYFYYKRHLICVKIKFLFLHPSINLLFYYYKKYLTHVKVNFLFLWCFAPRSRSRSERPAHPLFLLQNLYLIHTKVNFLFLCLLFQNLHLKYIIDVIFLSMGPSFGFEAYKCNSFLPRLTGYIIIITCI